MTDHPHLRGEDEWFSFLWGSFWLNIDKARRGLASGDIKGELHEYPVQSFRALLGLSENEFGSHDFEEPTSFDLLSAATSRSHMRGIPDEKLLEPGIIVMWKSADSMRRVGMSIDPGEDKPSPWLIDGNHRLSRLYLEGYGKPVAVWIIPYEEALKFAFDRSRRPIIGSAK
jgi:hypothetical protein